jgi:translation initiation factor IF-3
MNKNNKYKHFLNRDIRANEVRVVDVGVMSFKDAIALAESKEMDLVMISQSSDMPVCKIMDYQKFLYEQEKREKQKVLDLKEIKVGPNISQNDLNYRLKHMAEFLQKGHKVKITMQFKGREISYLEKGREVINSMISDISDFGSIDTPMKLEGKKLFVIIKPKK